MIRTQGVKRAVVACALLAGIGFGGYAIAHNISQGSRTTAPGFAAVGSWKPVEKKLPDGTWGGFIQYNGVDLPVMAVENGIRVGDTTYLLSNLTQPERYQVFSDVWYKQTPEQQKGTIREAIADYSATSIDAILNNEQKSSILTSQWAIVPKESKESLITTAWPNLDLKYRHGLVRQELDQLLLR
jgi:hypothetical protein